MFLLPKPLKPIVTLIKKYIYIYVCVRKESLGGKVKTSNIFVASLPKANPVNIYLLWESWYINEYVFSGILVKTWEVSYKGKLYKILLIRGGLAF